MKGAAQDDAGGTGGPASAASGTLRLAGGAGVSFVGKVGGRLVQVVGQVVFARWLGMADFGRLSLALTVLRILGLIAPLGLHRAAVVFGSRCWRIDAARFRGVVAETLGFAVASGVLSGAVLYFAASWLSREVFRGSVPAELLRVVAVGVPFVVLMRVAVELARVSQRMELATLAEDAAQPAVALAIFVGLAAVGGGLHGAAWASVLGYVAAGLGALGAVLHLFPELRASGAATTWNPREILVFAGPTSLAIFCGAFTSMLDRLIVGRYCPPEQMAVYQAAGQVSVAFTIIIGSFTTIFAPMAARYLATGDREELQKLFRTSTRWGLYLGAPLFLLVAAEPQAILGATFGDGYSQGATALVLLATGQIVNVATGNVGILLVSAGAQTSWLGLTFTATVLNGLVGLLLVQQHGILGAAAGNFVATVVLFTGATAIVWRRLGLWAYDAAFLKIPAAGILAFAMGATVDHWMATDTDLLRIVVSASVLGTGFFAALALLGLDLEDRVLLRGLLQKVRAGG